MKGECMLDPELLKNYAPLHNLTQDNLVRLAKRVVIEDVAKGSVICREGDPDSHAIYLLEGGVELRSHSTSMTRVLQGGTPDACFAVAPGRPRPYTVVATTPVRLFRIDNAALDRAVLLDEVSTTITRVHDSGRAFAGDSEWLEEMTSSPAFRSLPRERVALLMLKFEPIVVKAGDVVIRQGDPGSHYYVVKEGRLAVSRKDSDGKVKLVTELKRGSVFGEDALLMNEPRNASIVALSDGLVMRLPRSEFEELLKKPLLSYVSVAEAQAMLRDGAGLLDVRAPEDYRRGSLKGSVNLPIAELRTRLRELDAKRPYVLICANGRQSEVAAFLLAQRGFRVSVLRDGMRSVTPGA
jgi:CRP-like cAMP-binding protein